MATAAERQRQRRQRMRKDGVREVTVTVPADQAERVQRVAAALRAGQAVSPRLIPALQALRRARGTLADLDVVRAGIFGSVARGDDRTDSDIDVLLVFPADVVPRMKTVMRAETAAREAIQAELPEASVDVAIHSMLRAHVRPLVERDVVYVD
jgi:predicted nucleotidyltransferase